MSKQKRKLCWIIIKSTIRKVAEDVNTSAASCRVVFSDVLDIKPGSAKFIPKLLNFDQKNYRISIAQKLMNYVNLILNLFKRVIIDTTMKSKLKPSRLNGICQKIKGI